MKLAGLIDLCRENEVSVVAGCYALPIWEWGKKHVIGADYEIVEVIDDPDDPECKYCPGFGYPAMDLGLKDVRDQRPDEHVIGGDQILTCYNRPAPMMELREPFPLGDWVAIHPYTRHSWKNCRNVIRQVNYAFPVKVLGFPGEAKGIPEAWKDVTAAPFDEQVAAVAGCRFFVGVGSSWSNVATLFHKPMIHVSYTPDLAQFTNPCMIKMVEPTIEELQEQIDLLCGVLTSA